MIAAGLLARNARNKGLTTKPWVKTSLAPGSKVVTDYLEKSGLDDDLDALGFYTVGYGCTTCIGNSGPLPDPVHDGINEADLVAAAVLSGNRNFEGRISPHIKANYLASPPLVVAYALAGRLDVDLSEMVTLTTRILTELAPAHAVTEFTQRHLRVLFVDELQDCDQWEGCLLRQRF